MSRKTLGWPSSSEHTTLFQVQQGGPHSLRLQIQHGKAVSDSVLAFLSSYQASWAANPAPKPELRADPCSRRRHPALQGQPLATQLVPGPARVSFGCSGTCFVSREKSANTSDAQTQLHGQPAVCCLLGRAHEAGGSCSRTPAPTLPLCWDCVLPTSPSLFCLLPPRCIRVHSCRMEQLGGTSRLRFCQARSACASPGGESCGRSEERTEGKEPWACLAQGARSTHTERTAQRPPPAGSFPQNVPGEALGLQPGAAPRGWQGGEHTHSWWALQL